MSKLHIKMFAVFLFICFAYFALAVAQHSSTYAQTSSNHRVAEMKILAPRTGQPILKPEFDKADYMLSELPNQMRVLYVSDPRAHIAEVTLHVSVGYFADIPAFAGGVKLLAMHLMGSRSNNKTLDFHKVITKFGGTSSLHVSETATIFHLRIPNIYLVEILKMFSTILMSIPHDGLINESLFNAFPDDQHAYYNLQSGLPLHIPLYALLPDAWLVQNNITFSKKDEDLSRQLHYFGRHVMKDLFSLYSANLMQLVVKSAFPIRDLQVVNVLFAEIKNRHISAHYLRRNLEPWAAMNPTEITKLIQARSQTKSLVVRWGIKEKSYWEDFNPIQFINHLLSHHGKGSLKSILKEKSLITDLEAFFDPNYFGQFTIDFRIQQSDMSSVEQILLILFEAIQALKGMEFKDSLIQNFRMTREVQFLNSVNLHEQFVRPGFGEMIRDADIPHTHLLKATYLTSDWQANFTSRVKHILNALNVTFQATLYGVEDGRFVPNFHPFGLQMYVDALPKVLLYKLQDIIRSNKQNLQMGPPASNPFALNVEDFFMGPPSPKLVLDLNRVRFFHQQLVHDDAPKVYFHCFFRSNMSSDARNQALLWLLEMHLVDGLNPFLQQALQTGAEIKLAKKVDGLTLVFTGLPSQFKVTMEKFMTHFTNLSPSLVKFNKMRAKVEEKLESENMEISVRLRFLLSTATRKKYVLPEKVRDGLSNVTLIDFLAFKKAFKQSMFVEILYAGHEIWDQHADWLRAMFTSPAVWAAERPRFKPVQVVKVPPGNWVYQDNTVKFDVNLVSFYVQLCTECELRTRSLLHLYSRVVELYKNLTHSGRNTMDASVDSYIDFNGPSLGYILLLSDPDTNSTVLEKFISGYFVRVQTFLESLTEQQLQIEVDEVIHRLKFRLESVQEMGSKLWDDIQNIVNSVPPSTDLFKIMKTVTLDELKQFEKANFRISRKLRKFSIHLLADDDDQDASADDDAEDFGSEPANAQDNDHVETEAREAAESDQGANEDDVSLQFGGDKFLGSTEEAADDSDESYESNEIPQEESNPQEISSPNWVMIQNFSSWN